MKSLKEKIISREAHVAVVGLGYVGLPLACAFASKGYKVTAQSRYNSYVGMLEDKDEAKYREAY